MEDEKITQAYDTIISYIEYDAEILMPVESMFDEKGQHITKKEYGKILIEVLCQELRERFILVEK